LSGGSSGRLVVADVAVGDSGVLNGWSPEIKR